MVDEIWRLAGNVMRPTKEITDWIDETQQVINRLMAHSEAGAKRIDEEKQFALDTLLKLAELISGCNRPIMKRSRALN